MKIFFRIIIHRNTILIIAFLAGLFLGDFAHHFKSYTIYILAFVMSFSLTGINFKAFSSFAATGKRVLYAIFLNYIVLSGIILLITSLVIQNPDLYTGLVIVAATPPGVAIIPFSHSFKGDINYSVAGVAGSYLAAIAFAPLIAGIFSQQAAVSPLGLLWLIVQVLIVPLLISRLLLIKKLKNFAVKARGRVVDFGFGAIIFIAVGVNRNVFFNDFDLVFQSSIVLISSIFGLGLIYEFFRYRLFNNRAATISETLMITTKSSGFAAATALSLSGSSTAVPSAVLSVLVLAFLLYQSFKFEIRKRKGAENKG